MDAHQHLVLTMDKETATPLSPIPPPTHTAHALPQLNVVARPPRATRRSLLEIVGMPANALRRLSNDTARLPVVIGQRVAMLHKGALKVSASNTSGAESQLRLGRLGSSDVSALVSAVKLTMVLGPILQLIWTIFIEPDRPTPETQQAFALSGGDRLEAVIQLMIVVPAWISAYTTLRFAKREPLQIALVNLIVIAALISAITFTADFVKSFRQFEKKGRQLLSAANACLAAFIFLSLSWLTDHFVETIFAMKHTLQHQKQERILHTSRRLSFVLGVGTGVYLAVRMALTCRSDLVFDFIPMTNFITPLRVRLIEGKDLEEAHALFDAVIISVGDMILFALTLIKCFFTHRLFDRIFISDFARRYTEYRVFVVNFRNIVIAITLSGHVAAWTVPFYHTIDPIHLSKERIPIGNAGSVQMQLGFRFTLALWLVSAMYYALPVENGSVSSRLCGKPTKRSATNRIKYFLFESDALLKTAFRDLRHAGHVNPNQFIMEQQIEAFNFAQLVYARGNKKYDQDIESLQKLVGDSSYKVVEVIQNTTTDTHCLILASDAKAVVTFRGTLSKKNAKTDLQSAMTLHISAKTVDFVKLASLRPRTGSMIREEEIRTLWHRITCRRNDPKVHSGFYAAYLSVADRVLDRLRSLQAVEKRAIVVTGHSLGGALAALCSFDIVTRLNITNVSCTTFGCPRIGNHAFKKRYTHAVPATFAIVNASDMITKLPPKTPKAQSYTSVGTTVLVNSCGNLVIDPNMLELGMLHRGYSPKAHTMGAYLLSLLLWCLRSHEKRYHPSFWRQSLAVLRAEYSYLPEVRAFLEASLVHINLHSGVSIDSGANRRLSTRAQLRGVVRHMEAALRQAQEELEDEALALSLWSQFRRWVCWSDPYEWFDMDEAVRFLVSHLGLENAAAALDLCQLLSVQGLVKPSGVVVTQSSRFCFLVTDDDEEEEEEDEEDGGSVKETPGRVTVTRPDASPRTDCSHGE